MSEPSAHTPGWIWLLSGLVLGLFIAFLIYVNSNGPVRVGADATMRPANVQPAPTQEAPGTVGRTRFEFYNLLPNREVTLPEPGNRGPTNPPASATAPVATPTTAATAPTGRTANVETIPARPKTTYEAGEYLVQVGSFRDFNDADTMKAQLAFIGVEASIQSVRLANGQEWHRVRIGPSRDMEYLNSVQSVLAQNDYESMLLKISK